MPDLIHQLSLFFIALAANTLSAVAGGGAGLVQLPALIFLGLPFAIALATHKIATVALGLGATIRHWRQGSLDYPFALFILATGLPGVVLGAYVVPRVPDQVAQMALGVLTICLALYSFLKKGMGEEYQQRHRLGWGNALGGLVLFSIGILNGALASGTGLFVTLWLVRWWGMDYKRAVAYTLILVGLFWNGSGALTLALLTEVRWSWLPPLLVGSVLGGYLGAHLAIIGSNRIIKRIYEVVTLLVGLKLVLP